MTCCTAAIELDRVRQAATDDIQNLQADIVAKNREIGWLKRELSEVIDEDSPEAQSVKALLGLWWREVKNSDARVKHDLNSTRAPKVRKALKRRGVELCQKAILGVLYDDWAMGRISKSGGKDFNDIADHILATDASIERFAKLHDRHQERPKLEVVPDSQPRRKRKIIDAPIDRVLGALPGEWRVTPNPDEWEAQCPVPEHGDQDPSLVIRRNPDGQVWIKCWAGCEKERILEVLNLGWRDLWDRSEDDHGAASWPFREKGSLAPHLRSTMVQMIAREERKAA